MQNDNNINRKEYPKHKYCGGPFQGSNSVNTTETDANRSSVDDK